MAGILCCLCESGGSRAAIGLYLKVTLILPSFDLKTDESLSIKGISGSPLEEDYKRVCAHLEPPTRKGGRTKFVA
jgi:hypothetical protein